jgi:N-acetylneuraminate 9-O-acetyltransferase
MSLLTDTNDPYKCGALLNEGQWLDPPEIAGSRKPFGNWQPPGCMIHQYAAKPIEKCLPQRRMLFVGDSTIRQVFWATAKKLDKKQADEIEGYTKKHSDIQFESNGVQVHFIWDPYLNSTSLHAELTTYKKSEQGDKKAKSAAVILVGGGQWFARHIETNALKQFKGAIDEIMPFMGTSKAKGDESSKAGIHSVSGTGSNLLLLAPVQVPWYDSLSPSRATTMKPEEIDAMNDYLQQLSNHQGADVAWSYSLMTAGQKDTYEESGIHVVDNVNARKADVLLNLRCNAEAAKGVNGQGYPFDRTCCSNYRRPGWSQLIIILVAILGLPVTVWLSTMGKPLRLLMNLLAPRLSRMTAQTERRLSMPSSKVTRATLVFLGALLYCFYADRTQIFDKANKYYTDLEFFRLCEIVVVLGLLSIRRSVAAPPAKPGQVMGANPDQPVLSRDQTDEWKGWMQFAILIYHWTGASKVLWIYEAIRVMVAAYLFQTGFGHTVFFFKKGDFSLKRAAGVLVRLNLLSCALPYIMRTDYLFYYFAPLVSFWFLVVYLTMRVGNQYNQNLTFLIAKILASAALVTGFVMIPGPLEVIFWVIEKTCRIHWNLYEWRFRVFLDMFIVYWGMFAGLLYCKLMEKNNPIVSSRSWPLLRRAAIGASAVLLPGYFLLIQRSPSKNDYNWWQPYISIIPIFAFVVLRNATQGLRNFHSSIFAWIGKCSLETFTFQFHIWLAGDTRGLLDIGIFGARWQNLVAVTPVFLYVSWCVSGATGELTKYILSPVSAKAVAAKEAAASGENGTPLLPLTSSGQDARGETHARRLSREQNGNGTMHDVGLGAAPGRVVAWKEKASTLWNENLKFRLGALVFAMWFLNFVS